MFPFLQGLTLSPTRLMQPGKNLMLALPMRAKLAMVATCVLLPLAALVVWGVMPPAPSCRCCTTTGRGCRWPNGCTR
jgi:hypothetical protein